MDTATDTAIGYRSWIVDVNTACSRIIAVLRQTKQRRRSADKFERNLEFDTSKGSRRVLVETPIRARQPMCKFFKSAN